MSSAHEAAIDDLKSFRTKERWEDAYRTLTPFSAADVEDVFYAFDGSLIEEVLRSPDFEVFSLAGSFAEISARTGIDLQTTVDVLAKMPIFLNGVAHKEGRAEMAAALGRNREAQKEVIDRMLDEILGTALQSGVSFDLTNDFTLPLYYNLSAAILEDDPVETAKGDEYPRILEPMLSLLNRKSINDQMSVTIGSHENPHIDANTRMALLILGHDTFVGAMALSLWKVIEANNGARLSDIDWPTTLPATSAPLLDRFALKDWSYKDFHIKKGQRVRCYMEASTIFGPLDNHDLVFGKGRHACIGRALTENTWRKITAKFASSDLHAEVTSLELREPDNFFRFPIQSNVRFYD